MQQFASFEEHWPFRRGANTQMNRVSVGGLSSLLEALGVHGAGQAAEERHVHYVNDLARLQCRLAFNTANLPHLSPRFDWYQCQRGGVFLPFNRPTF